MHAGSCLQHQKCQSLLSRFLVLKEPRGEGTQDSSNLFSRRQHGGTDRLRGREGLNDFNILMIASLLSLEIIPECI
jgi:hypothetical protein